MNVWKCKNDKKTGRKKLHRATNRNPCTMKWKSIYGLFPISRCLQLKSLQGRLYASLVTIRLRLPGASFTKCVSTAWSLHLTTPPGCAIHKILDRLAWLLSDSASGRVFYDLVSTAWSFLSDDTSRVPRLQITFSSKEGG